MNNGKAILLWLWEDAPQKVRDDVTKLMNEMVAKNQRRDWLRSISSAYDDDTDDDIRDLNQLEAHFVAFAPRHADDIDETRICFTFHVLGQMVHHESYYFEYEGGKIIVYYRRKDWFKGGK